MNTKTRTALRATLKQEDAALAERLPELAPPPAAARPAQPVARQARTASTPKAGFAPKPVTTATPAPAPAAVVPPAAESAASATPATPPAGPEEPRRERFTLGAGDWRRLKILREELGEAGYRPSRSELVRAALVALGARGSAEVLALVRALAPLADEAAADKPGKSRKGAAGKAARKHTTAKKAIEKKASARDKHKADGRKR
ncbi:MAG: hypothetical protein ACYC5W_02765 [Thauera sp.]